MATRFVSKFSEPMGQAWQRPLSLGEGLYVGAALFALGTAYCQVYCAISMPAMDGMTMPLSLSMWRSAIETVPALIAFELAKRVMGATSGPRTIAGVAGALLVAAMISTAMVFVCHGLFYSSAMPLRPIIADRLPGITLTAIAIAWASRQARGIQAAALRHSATELPPAEWIDWVRSAGNYVEVRANGRSVLKRMTMAQAEQALSANSFVRVHRSMLVNRDRIVGLDRSERPRHLRLADGTHVKVGEAFRANLG